MTWWCERSLHLVCVEYGYGKGVGCECTCHGDGTFPTEGWVVIKHREVLAHGTQKKDVMGQLLIPSSNRRSTGIYEYEDYVICKADKIKEVIE
jgi:hypothetical protein